MWNIEIRDFVMIVELCSSNDINFDLFDFDFSLLSIFMEEVIINILVKYLSLGEIR